MIKETFSNYILNVSFYLFGLRLMLVGSLACMSSHFPSSRKIGTRYSIFAKSSFWRCYTAIFPQYVVGCRKSCRNIGFCAFSTIFNYNVLPCIAIKCNHGSGYNMICKDKEEFDTKKASATLDKWIKERYGIQFTEQGIYDRIPRRILAEEFIETADGLPPKDFKFFCSYGKVKFLFVASDRYDTNTKFDYYYPDWTYIPVQNFFENNGPIEKPAALERMIHYAEVLSEDFPLVRVDFYNEGNRIIMGEMTFTHFGCLNRFEPESYDELFGSYFPDVDELEKWSSH